MPNVQIIYKGTRQEIANYPVILTDRGEPPTPQEYAANAWERAIDNGLVDPDRKDEYEFRVTLLEVGYGPDNDLWPQTLLDGARGCAAVSDAAVSRLGPISASDSQYLVIARLLAESIELALKAYLRLHGYSEAQLMRIRHNLPRVLDAAVRRGFPKPHPTDVQLLRLLDATYGPQKLRYPRAPPINLPILCPVRELASEYLVHSFLFLGGSPTLLGDRSAKARGLFIDEVADYGVPSLADFRRDAAGVNLRSLGTVQ